MRSQTGNDKEIQEYVLKEHGLKVSNLYISQVKRKCGIEVGENYNLPKSEDSRQPQCPEEKEKAIRDALEHFAMDIQNAYLAKDTRRTFSGIRKGAIFNDFLLKM